MEAGCLGRETHQRQAESGPAVLASRALVDLLERAPDAVELVCRDADARVRHLDAHMLPVLGFLCAKHTSVRGLTHSKRHWPA